MSRTTSFTSRTSAWEDLPAAVCKELHRQGRGARGGSHHLLDLLRGVRAVFQRVERELAVAADGEQDVVEVMGDAPGEAADGLELVGLSQLGLQPRPMLLRQMAVGDVDGHADRALGDALLVDEAPASGLHPTLDAVRPAEPVLDIEVGPLLEGDRHRLVDTGAVLRVNPVEECLVGGLDLGRNT